MQQPSMDLDSKVAQLKEMGFYDENEARELLVRYHGNISRVVEILSRA